MKELDDIRARIRINAGYELPSSVRTDMDRMERALRVLYNVIEIYHVDARREAADHAIAIMRGEDG